MDLLKVVPDVVLAFSAEATERDHPDLPKGETLELLRVFCSKSAEELRATETPERCAAMVQRMKLVAGCGDTMLRMLGAKLGN